MHIKLYAGVAFAALMLPASAYAQSTGSTEIEEGDEVIVTGTRGDGSIGGVIAPNQPKAQVRINEDLIRKQRPGQSVNEIINLVPGVSNQSNDPYGSGGGGFRIRGFDSSRVSQTQDGIPLNDTGNYAIYTNQQQDPETLESVTVNLGSTDVDSPTASAVGGTVNIRTRRPGNDIGAYFSASYGDLDFHRVFGMLDTGDITGLGTTAFASASWTSYDNPFNNYGVIRKQQYNARIYQELGTNGDFISIAGNYNQNRNNFFGSGPLRSDAGRAPGTGSGSRFPTNFDEAQYFVDEFCSLTPARAGVIDNANTCATEFDRRYNPSNTGNVRGQSRFTLAESLILTVDANVQFTKANGGGVGLAREGARIINGVPYYGFIGGQYYYGTDVNGDGDRIDTCNTTGAACASASNAGVRMLNPSQTKTRRVGAVANLIYDLTPDHRFRVAYTYDDGNHRQTGETGRLFSNGEPTDVFPVNDPILDVNGNVVQKRNRRSFATLHQASGEYRGKLLDETLIVTAGVRVPFFRRELNQFCFTTAANGNVDCIADSQVAAYAAANPLFAAPQTRTFNYDKVLPNVGATFSITPELSVFGSYAAGISAPQTDQLYNSFFFAEGTPEARPAPETTDSFDAGLRFNSGIISGSVGAFLINFQNRIATAFDPVLGENVSRNIGEVRRYGFDGNISVQPTDWLTAYVFGSFLDSEIKDDLIGGNCRAADVGIIPGCTAAGQQIVLDTGGKQEAGVSRYLFGGRLELNAGPALLGIQAKRTGPRFVNDVNAPFQTTVTTGGVNTVTELYPARTPAYNVVDLDARFSLANWGLQQTFFQLNVSNLFNQFYVGNISGNSGNFVGSTSAPGAIAVPFVQFGAPRAVSGSIVVAF